ncbi:MULTISPECIES: hypothetical protein [Streptomyces]|uniref:hypothetical protein n=1 Tax=Streptomyces TaxID=1883 RepID=UPI0031D89307
MTDPAPLTPADLAARAEHARRLLHAWNGYDPSPAERARLDAEIDRRMAEARRMPGQASG